MRILTTAVILEPATRERVVAYLLRHETTHCLFLQNTALKRTDPRDVAPGTGPGATSNSPVPISETRLWAAEHGDEIVAVAAWTPPFSLLVSLVAEGAAIPALVTAIQDQETLPLGLLAPDPVAARFADEWCTRLLFSQRVAMRECVYDLDEVHQPTNISGCARLATVVDRGTLIRLANSFAGEALAEEEQGTVDVSRLVDGRFAAPNWWMVWEHRGEIVSIASANGETPHAMRIGPVYTPPAHRRRGYAGALTAAVAQRILDTGHDRAMLFTDLANPTSNHIYREIGFRPVTEFSLIAFTPSGELRT